MLVLIKTMFSKPLFSSDAFTRYARFCFERWGPKVKYWITFNEIHSFAGAGYSSGAMAPGRCSDRSICKEGNSSTEPFIVGHHALLSHAHAVDIYRKEFKVSFYFPSYIIYTIILKILTKNKLYIFLKRFQMIPTSL